MRLSRMTEYIIKKHPVSTKREAKVLIKAKSCNSLLHMLLLCICSYLKSVPRRKILILDTHHPDTIYLLEQKCKDPWLFCEAKRRP